MKPPRNFHPEPFAYHEEIDLRIDDLTNLGAGVGRIDGWVVFVPYSLPGERVRARVWRNKRQYSEADLVELLEASAERIEAECPLFGICGGCQYQHYAYSAQLEWKRHQIVQLLKKMAGSEAPVNPCLGNADRTYGYRSKITPHFRRPPHLPGTPIGFQKAASRAVVDVPHCPIASPRINEALKAERARLHREPGRFRKGGTLLLRDTPDGVVTDMKAVVRERIGSFSFDFIAGEFFQNNPHVLPVMVDYVLDRAAQPGIDVLVDAYCGAGVFGICGHDRFKTVVGIEVSERAVALARDNAERNRAANVSILPGSAEAVFRNLPAEPEAACVLMDPPRKGSDPLFLDQLVAYGPARIVYVSCGPDTQMRDLCRLLEGGYRIEDVQPVDLFPQTRHIENIITLVRGPGAVDSSPES